jgi:cytochrome c
VGVRFLKLLGCVLVTLAIGFTARPGSHPAASRADPGAVLNAQTPVPAPVMSTVRRACFDCHSDETRWPWYAGMPMASWFIERDVKAGRGQVNFSRWTQYNPFDRADMLDRICGLATTGNMPPLPYRVLHAEARLSETDVVELCAWTRQEARRLVEGGS